MSVLFIPGIELCERFYKEIVHPILIDRFPGLAHGAALVGSGSEVLGFAEALSKQIEDPVVKRMAERPLIGSLDLLSDNTDLIENPSWRPLVRQLYQ